MTIWSAEDEAAVEHIRGQIVYETKMLADPKVYVGWKGFTGRPEALRDKALLLRALDRARAEILEQAANARGWKLAAENDRAYYLEAMALVRHLRGYLQRIKLECRGHAESLADEALAK